MTTRYVGGRSRFSFMTSDLGGQVSNPGVVLIKVKNPDGFEKTYKLGVDSEIVQVGDGAYKFEIAWTKSGVWHIRFVALATENAPSTSQFAIDVPCVVQKTQFRRPFAST